MITPFHSYPKFHLPDITASFYNAAALFKIDLLSVHHQISVAADYGGWTMFLWLRNMTQTFQSFIWSIVWELDFAHVTLEDLLIASLTRDEHPQRSSDHRTVVHFDKRERSKTESTVSGHVITSEGTKPYKNKTDSILDFALSSSFK